MSVRSMGRDSPELDEIVCYFMRTILHLQKNGLLDLPLEEHLNEPYHSFLGKCMDIFCRSLAPELSRLLLDAEHDALLSQGPLTAAPAPGLRPHHELCWHIYYDEDPYTYLDTTQELWGQKAMEYSWRTYYPNLPKETIKKLHLEDELAAFPEELRHPDNY